MPGQDAADERGRNGGQEAHHAQGFQAHVLQFFVAFIAFVEIGQGLDLVADFAVGGKVARAVAVIDAELPGGFSLGGEVF